MCKNVKYYILQLLLWRYGCHQTGGISSLYCQTHWGLVCQLVDDVWKQNRISPMRIPSFNTKCRLVAIKKTANG